MNRLEKIIKTVNSEYKTLEVFYETLEDIRYVWGIKEEMFGWDLELENELNWLKQLNRDRKIEFLERMRENFEIKNKNKQTTSIKKSQKYFR